MINKRKPKIVKKKKITKRRSEINVVEINKTIQKINESKSWFYEKKKN